MPCHHELCDRTTARRGIRLRVPLAISILFSLLLQLLLLCFRLLLAVLLGLFGKSMLSLRLLQLYF
jgi:hypothetical protein